MLLLALGVPAGASAKTPVTAGDRAATRDLLEAEDALEHRIVASAPASNANVKRLARRLRSECTGVLADVPRPEESLTTSLSGHILPPRARGESERQRRQLLDVAEELSLAFYQARLAPLRGAVIAYAQIVASLHWTDLKLTSYEHAEAAAIEWELRASPPHVCQDLRYWARSGYGTLSAATRLSAEEAASHFEAVALSLEGSGISMTRFESRRDKALSAETQRLEEAQHVRYERRRTVELQAEVALGTITEEQAANRESVPAGSTLLAKGRTAAGGSYTIRAEPKLAEPPADRKRCSVTLRTAEESGEDGREDTASEACLSRAHPDVPTVRCKPPLLEIAGQVGPQTRRVRLTLSDGRQIVSPVALVPAKIGGPLGFYFQMVRGPSPIPVSLSELGPEGRVLRTVKLPRETGCTQPKRRTLPPLVGSLLARTPLARGSVPGGPRFLITAEHDHGAPLVEVQLEVRRPDDEALFSLPDEESISVTSRPAAGSKPLTWALETGCRPHEYAVLYGVLRESADTVLVRTAAGLVPLAQAQVPTKLKLTGVLAYGAFSEVPSEIVVENAAGAAISSENLAARVQEAREVCEGDAEPPA